MAESIVEPVVETVTEPINEPVVEPVVEKVVEPAKEIMIPKERFDEVNNKQKELAVQVTELLEAKEALANELKEMKGASAETQTLKDTTTQLQTEVQKYEALLGEMVTTKLKAIPEEMQDLVPDGLTTEQKLAWLNKAEEKGLFKKQAQVVVGTPLNHSADADAVEKVQKMNPLQALVSFYSGSK